MSRMSRMPLLGLVLLSLTVLLGGCDDGDDTNLEPGAVSESIVPIDCAAAAAVTTVAITASGFSPQSVTFTSTAVVRWVNNDTVAHSVLSGPPVTATTVGETDEPDGSATGGGTDGGTDDGGGIIGGINTTPGLIGPVITPGALFDSGPLSTGQTYCVDFSKLRVAASAAASQSPDDSPRATLLYHCEIHPAETGSLTIVAPAGAAQ